MIPYCVRSTMLIKMVYHSLLYDKCTMNYDQICPQKIFFKLTQLFMHTHRVIIQNELRSGFFYTKTDISTLCLDGYSVSVQ